MAEILLNLSGQGGLDNRFAGDVDMLTPKYETSINTAPSELAGGLYNPYIRQGYLHPATNTYATLTHTPTSSILFSSAVYDNLQDVTYWAQYGNKIYLQENQNDTTIEELLALDSDYIITDVELYEKNGEPTLYFTYLTDKVLMETTFGGVAPNFNYTMSINGVSSRPQVLAADSITGATSLTLDVVVPTGVTNTALIVFVTSFNPITVTLDATPLTLVQASDHFSTTLPLKIECHRILGLTSGTKTLSMSASGDAAGLGYVLLSGVNQATPINEIKTQEAHDVITYNEVTSGQNLTYLQCAFARLNTRTKIPLMNIESWIFDPSAQTTTGGSTIFSLYTGSTWRVYVDNAAAVVFQYSTTQRSWSTLPTYDTKSLDISAQLGSNPVSAMRMSPDGTKFYATRSGSNNMWQYNLGTAFDISTGVYDDLLDVSLVGSSGVGSFDFSKDGLTLYVAASNFTATPYGVILQYSLSSAFDITTATYTGKMLRVGSTSDQISSGRGLSIDKYESEFYIQSQDTKAIHGFRFDKRYPLDVTKAKPLSGTYLVPSNYNVGNVEHEYTYMRTTASGTKFGRVFLHNDFAASASNPADQILWVRPYSDFPRRSISLSYLDRDSKVYDVGVFSNKHKLKLNSEWLTTEQEVYDKTFSDTVILREADNGFMYIMAGNKVHKIDGGVTGGAEGTVTKNVLLFPDYFTITDAVDFRSAMYIAINTYRVPTSTTNQITTVGKVGVYVWDRISTQLSRADFIEIPGAREIKKIYASPDGMVKMITISESGLTELRRFGYNDSGGVVFPVKKLLGVGGFPQFPDGLTTVGDKVCWLANNGKILCEQDSRTENAAVSVTQIAEVKAQGTSLDGVMNNIKSGAMIFGSGLQTSDAGFRSNKQALTFSYQDGVSILVKKVYPFDLKGTSNATQTPHQGDVYTGVQYIPITSTVRTIRIYNAPITGTGTDAVATVKIYFNQSTSATIPNGMTKTITKSEAKRGYVDFQINKPYVHAIQIEVEWATGVPLGEDTYLPSVAVISTDETTTKSPDNG